MGALRELPTDDPYKLFQDSECDCQGCSVLSHVRFFATLDCCPPGSSVHVISQAGVLQWVAISSSRGSL